MFIILIVPALTKMIRKLFFLALTMLALSSSVLSIKLKQFNLPGIKSKDSDKEGDKEKKKKEDKAKAEDEKSHQSPFSGPKKETKEDKTKKKDDDKSADSGKKDKGFSNPFSKKKDDDKSSDSDKKDEKN